MLIISHRGNIEGPIPNKENQPEYLLDAAARFHVEVDVWWHEHDFWLGHDGPQYPTSREFLKNPKFWVHAKNVDAVFFLKYSGIERYFFHDTDDVTLTSMGDIWTYPGKHIVAGAIYVLPERNWGHWLLHKHLPYGVCTDYPTRIGNETAPDIN